jgi:hypothetical protein
MTRFCARCSAAFDITDADMAFYEKVSPVFGGKTFSISPPAWCPDCRMQRRMAFRNQIYVYSRPSSSTGKQMFSLYPEHTPFPVIDKDEWWSDAFDATVYGRDIDFTRPFFDQFRDLMKVVPHFSISVTNPENSEYCNNGSEFKNCYLVFNTSFVEDSMNSESVWHSKDCLDCNQTTYSELCYDCVDCTKCYDLQSSEGCTNCTGSRFLLNCRSSKDCFGCANLRHKQYCIFNTQYSQAEYEAYIRGLDLSSFAQREAVRDAVQKFWVTQPRPHMQSSQTEGATGDHLSEVRDAQQCFFVRQAENVKYCTYLNEGAKDCMDHTLMGLRSELIYESSVCGYDSQRIRFCFNCWPNNADLFYCWLGRGISDCFGCISLKKKRFCILNKQYTEADYKALVPKLIEHMRKTGEWGEFFPLDMAPCPYNRSLAWRFFPMDQAAVKKQGLSWYEEAVNRQDKASDLPDGLPASDDSLVATSLQSGKSFRIPGQEVKKCRRMKVPLPRLAYDERINRRVQKLGGVRLYQRTCAKTGNALLTTFAPDSPWIVWDRDEYEKTFG